MDTKKYYNREEAAKYLGLGVSTLAAWASNGAQDLPYSKMGRMVRYRKEDLDAFMEAGIQTRGRFTEENPQISPPPDPNSDLYIVSAALIKINKVIDGHSKLDAINSILAPHNIEKNAKVMQACYRQLIAIKKGDEATAEIWAHKIKLLTVTR